MTPPPDPLQLTRLRVEQLRRFRQPLELAGFAPGLNILAGPNEAGKSTLVRAIRAAFFERHKSSVVEDLRPWGEGSGAAPRVELDFLWDGQPHRLVKSFLGRKRCTLAIGARTLDGAEAEDHLARLFGFSHAARGESRPEHWGIPGLLWVEQGTGHELDVRHAREHLHDALRSQVDPAAADLAATGGDALLAQLHAQRAMLLTGTGRPRADYQDALDAAERLRADVASLDARIAEYRQQVDQLAQLRAQHDADAAARPWEALRQQLDAAHRRQADLQARQAQLAADRARADELEQTRALLARELDLIERQQDEAARRAQALEDAEQAWQAAQAEAAAAGERAAQAAARTAAARAASRAATQQAARQARRAQADAAQAEADRLRQACTRAAEAQAHRQALRAQLAVLPPLDAARLQHLRQRERTRADAAVRRQAVATRLAFTLPPGERLLLEAGPAQWTLEGRGEQLLDAPATLRLAGGGELRITPGGEDLAALAQAHRHAQHALQEALDAAGVSDLAQAEAQLLARDALRAQEALAAQAVALVAPAGLEALQAEAAAAQARAAACAQAAAGDTADAANPPDLPSPAQAEAAEQAAGRAEQAAQHALAAARQQAAAAQGARDAARREAQAAQALLADPARAERQARAHERLLATAAEAQAVRARAEQEASALATARPDIVAQDIVRLQRSVEQMAQAHQERHERLLVLQASLRQAGAQGLEEMRATRAAECTRARRRAEELARRAAALDLLCRKLEARRQATLERLQAPLQERLRHYLPLLLPDATLHLDARLAPDTLARRGDAGAEQAGEVAALSFGAREQIGLISRLAYADLLREAGRPTLLILDDALAHSDAGRLALMKRVLFDAAQRHQVLLFTCHPASWRDMGVALRMLPDG